MMYFFPFLLLVMGMTLFPVLFTFFESTVFADFSLFRTVFQDTSFRVSAQVSSFYSFVSSLLVFVCGSTMAFWVYRFPKTLQRAAFFFFFLCGLFHLSFRFPFLGRSSSYYSETLNQLRFWRFLPSFSRDSG